MPRRAKELPRGVLQAVSAADLVIHLGDFTEVTLVSELRRLAPLCAIHGNNDSEEVRSIFPDKKRLEVNGHVLQLIHGDKGARTALAAARNVCDAEVVLFGHSHRPCCENEAGILLFNPGSPTDP
jgi:putative phosphoesterase